jgi:hypothetical protein
MVNLILPDIGIMTIYIRVVYVILRSETRREGGVAS